MENTIRNASERRQIPGDVQDINLSLIYGHSVGNCIYWIRFISSQREITLLRRNWRRGHAAAGNVSTAWTPVFCLMTGKGVMKTHSHLCSSEVLPLTASIPSWATTRTPNSPAPLYSSSSSRPATPRQLKRGSTRGLAAAKEGETRKGRREIIKRWEGWKLANYTWDHQWSLRSLITHPPGTNSIPSRQWLRT